MAITQNPPSKPGAPTDLTENSDSPPGNPTDQTRVAPSDPGNPTQQTRVTPSDPGNPTNLSENAVVTPGNPTVQTRVSPSDPGNPTNLTEVSAVTPGNPTQQTRVPESPPGNPTNLAEIAESPPGNPTNLSENAVVTPGNPTDLTRNTGSFPRTLTPRIDLNFAANGYEINGVPKAVSDAVTYSRASSGMYNEQFRNQWGQFDYRLATDYVGTVTNLATYSEQFDNSDWTKTNSSVSSNKIANPVNGARDADLLLDTTASAGHLIAQSAGASVGLVTHSWYVKSYSGNRDFRLRAGDSGGFIGSAYFDPDVGVIRNDSAVTAAITYIGDGWFRASITFNSSTGSSISVHLDLVEKGATATTYTGDGQSGLYIWGAQLTESAKPLPYVKTTTASASETFTASPRLAYDAATGAALGYLAEGSTTNLIGYSEQTDNPLWVKTRSTISSNAIVAPDKTKSANLLIADTNNDSHFVSQSTSFTAGIRYTMSAYAKYSGYDINLIYGASAFTAGQRGAKFNLLTGTVVEEDTNTEARIEYIGDGWYRCSVSATAVASVVDVAAVQLINGTNPVFAGNGSSGAYIWGIQHEAQPFATSYVRTEGSTVSRSADQLSMVSAGVIPQRPTTIAIDYDYRTLPSGGVGFSRIPFYVGGQGSDQAFLGVIANGDVQVKYGSAAQNPPSLNGLSQTAGIFTIVANIDQTGSIYLDDELSGGLSSIDFVNDPSKTLFIGSSLSGGSPIYGYIKRFMVYDQALTAQEVSLL